jgi:hypothetical protein
VTHVNIASEQGEPVMRITSHLLKTRTMHNSSDFRVAIDNVTHTVCTDV